MSDGDTRGVTDPAAPGRTARVETAIHRAARPARWLSRFLGRAAIAGVVAAAILWWFGFRDELSDGGTGVAESLVAAGLLLVPAVWLLNARAAFRNLAELPETATGLARRGADQLRRPPAPARAAPQPQGRSVPGAARSVFAAVREAGDLLAGRALVAQLAAVPFWLLTLFALLAVPVLALFALIAVIADLAQ